LTISTITPSDIQEDSLAILILIIMLLSSTKMTIFC